MLYSLTTCFLKSKKESPANPLVYWTFWRRVRDSNPRAISLATRFRVELVMTTSITLHIKFYRQGKTFRQTIRQKLCLQNRCSKTLVLSGFRRVLKNTKKYFESVPLFPVAVSRKNLRIRWRSILFDRGHSFCLASSATGSARQRPHFDTTPYMLIVQVIFQ